VLAANEDADAPALTATDDDGRLIGVIPVVPLWRAFRIPLPVLVSADPFHSLGAPLLDRDQADQAAAKLIGQARDAGAHALMLRYLTLDGATAQAFGRVAAQEGLRPRILRSWSRAFLDARSDVPLAQRGIRAKKLKELRRLRNRLGECGDVTFAIARGGDDVAAAFDRFLELEASGWKGRNGSALAQQPALASRIRRAVVALADQGQCEIATLSLEDTPIAAGIILRHLDRAFFFKLGIDERFARFSPGVQLVLELTRHLCLDPDIAAADSTARAGHPMIDQIWRERLLIGDLLIPLRRHDPLLPVIEGSLRGYHATRALAQRWLKR
jgi:CelD/BcsL family acetyltransferase involved in cellulose biosynthesis